MTMYSSVQLDRHVKCKLERKCTELCALFYNDSGVALRLGIDPKLVEVFAGITEELADMERSRHPLPAGEEAVS